jgi:hypothetical protein
MCISGASNLKTSNGGLMFNEFGSFEGLEENAKKWDNVEKAFEEVHCLKTKKQGYGYSYGGF